MPMKPHPKYPLQDQMIEAMTYFLSRGTNADMARIARQFDAARDALYPNWREQYAADFIAWALDQGVIL